MKEINSTLPVPEAKYASIFIRPDGTAALQVVTNDEDLECVTRICTTDTFAIEWCRHHNVRIDHIAE